LIGCAANATGSERRPVIWTNPHYKARNVYFQFGHKADLFQSSAFTTLVLNAIRWASER
jgi:type 1 glutamine amidotransferase